MKASIFNEYQKATINRFKMIMDSHPKGYCDEQGLPSYTNPNPLMRWLVWRRVKVLLSAIESASPKYKKVLDFGCGYGLFLPFLIEHAKNTVAFDLNIKELKNIGTESGWERITYLDDYSKLSQMGKSFDLILASEVLEHVNDLEKTINDFHRLLTDDGFLLVSGPTENNFYKFGRKLSGYSGEYHVRNIYHIKNILAKYFIFKKITKIIPPLPFFEIILCENLS